MTLPVVFFRTIDGNEPAREFLKSLPRDDRRELGDRVARLLFCFQSQQIVVLHGLIEKSQSTPRADLSLAIKRMKEVMR